MSIAADPRYAIRLIDGPFADGTIISTHDRPPGDRIVVFESMFFPGVLLFEDTELDVLDGDALYERVTESALPRGFSHPNVVRGGAYQLVTS